jgi:hypothetical protein
MSDNTDHRTKRVPIATRIDTEAHAKIGRLAEQRRVTPAQIARVLIEDGVRTIATTEGITP